MHVLQVAYRTLSLRRTTISRLYPKPDIGGHVPSKHTRKFLGMLYVHVKPRPKKTLVREASTSSNFRPTSWEGNYDPRKVQYVEREVHSVNLRYLPISKRLACGDKK